VQSRRPHFLEGIRRRESLSALARERPDLLAPFESALLELGDEAGRLEDIFKLLGDYFTAEHRMIVAIKQKMSYPMMNAVAAIFIAPFPILFFGNAALYTITVVSGLVLALAFGGTLLLAAAKWYRRKRKFVLARLCRALALGVEAGLPLDRVVTLAVKAAADPDVAAHVQRLSARQRGSQTLADTFAHTIVPTKMLAALRVADASGNYGDTMKKLAALYDGDYGR
jgi:type II secretory pathway component PulF